MPHLVKRGMRHFSLGRLLIVLTIIAFFAAWRPDPGPTIALKTSLPRIGTIPQRANVLGYERSAFGPGWARLPNGCTTRDVALQHALNDAPPNHCPVRSGTGTDPYSGILIGVTQGADIELDHVYPLRAAWDMGAHSWTSQQRIQFANDPRNLIVASRETNQEKSDSLPSEWMPPDPQTHCWYARRVAEVAATWGLPLTTSDTKTMTNACFFRETIALPLR